VEPDGGMADLAFGCLSSAGHRGAVAVTGVAGCQAGVDWRSSEPGQTWMTAPPSAGT
jgi:nicotinamide mononucleotide (NMN) deamidase PncC